jgi:hypothetical protein
MRHYPGCVDYFYAKLYTNGRTNEVILVYNSIAPKQIQLKTAGMTDFVATISRGADESPYWALVKAWHRQKSPHDLSVEQICGLLQIAPEEYEMELVKFQIPDSVA